MKIMLRSDLQGALAPLEHFGHRYKPNRQQRGRIQLCMNSNGSMWTLSSQGFFDLEYVILEHSPHNRLSASLMTTVCILLTQP